MPLKACFHVVLHCFRLAGAEPVFGTFSVIII